MGGGTDRRACSRRGGDWKCLNKMSENINSTDHFEVLVARMRARFKMETGD
jgi:hypothetical protein